MRMRQRARMRAAGNEAGEMRHIDHQIGADAVGNAAEPGEIDDARIGAAAGNDQPRLVLFGEALDLVVIDAAVFGANPVMDGVEPFAGQIRRRAMGQMPTRGKRQAEHRIPRLQQGQEYRLVCLRSRMRLYVCERAAERAARSMASRSGNVDRLATTIIAAARIAFRVLLVSLSLAPEARRATQYFRSQSARLRLLANVFVVDRRRQFRIGNARSSVKSRAALRRPGLKIARTAPSSCLTCTFPANVRRNAADQAKTGSNQPTISADDCGVLPDRVSTHQSFADRLCPTPAG